MMNTSFPWFDLNNESEYQRWRHWKLSAYPADIGHLIVPIKHPYSLTVGEKLALQQRMNQYNMAIYACSGANAEKKIPLRIGEALGLTRIDANLGAGENGVTEIEVKDSNLHRRYIPYGSSRLSWHVDGYYNSPMRAIRAMMLHCVRPANSGGQSALMDIEMVYIRLRDESPAMLTALFDADCLTIPENVIEGKVLRATETGPVFSFDASGYLHMRYSARQRNIEWKQGKQVQSATKALTKLMSSDSPWVFNGTLAAGQGVICNNVLHNRSSFVDEKSATRLLYRVRYLDRVLTTAM